MGKDKETNLEEQLSEYTEAQILIAGGTYMTVLTSDWVCAIVFDKMLSFKKSPLCVGRAKQLANRLDDKRREYERMMKNIVSHLEGCYADMCQHFEDGLQTDLFRLENAIMLEFSRKKAKHPDALAKVELCRGMAIMSCRINDYVNDEAKRLNLRTNLAYMRQTALANTAVSLSEYLTKSYKKDISLNDNYTVVSGVMAIFNKIVKSDLVKRAYLSTDDEDNKH